MSAAQRLPGIIFVMVGPGGAGKNSIMKAVLAQSQRIRQLATATTRAMRAGEQQGREHLFVDEDEFRRMIKSGQLLEHQEVSPGKFYGIPRQTVVAALEAGELLIADIEVMGARLLSTAYPLNVVQIFVTVPGADVSEQLALLAARMLSRADQNTDIQHRLRRAQTLELPYQSGCDYTVVNDDLPRAISKSMQIIKSEIRARRAGN